MLLNFKLTIKNDNGETELSITRLENVIKITRKCEGEKSRTLRFNKDFEEKLLGEIEATPLEGVPDIEESGKATLWNITLKVEGQEKREICGFEPLSSKNPELFKIIEPLLIFKKPTSVDLISLSMNNPKGFNQEIIIDRKLSTLTIEQSNKDADDAEPSKSERKFTSKFIINSLCSDLSPLIDTLIMPKEPQSEQDGLFYKLSVTYSNNKEYVLCGPYNRTGVPENFEPFIERIRGAVKEFSTKKGFFDPCIEKCGPIKDGVIYLSVSFGGDKTYFYKTDDRTLRAGDNVLVPTGDNGGFKIVKIKSVDYYDKDEVPYPIEKVKSIVMKIQEKYVESESREVELKRFLCIYIPFLTAVSKRESILEWCENYKNSDEEDDEIGLLKLFDAMNKEAYACGLVFKNYREILSNAGISEGEVIDADDNIFEKADLRELTAAISFHFTLQSLNKEEFFQKSIVSGALLVLLEILDYRINK